MIRINRGREPQSLQGIRNTELGHLRNLGRAPQSDEINGYRIVAEDLWKVQHHKCCYCEIRIPKGFNDVEHYRPKALADRKPGSSDTHGYWWLSFTWENLLFACPACNRSSKNSRFPLDSGAVALVAESPPPGDEIPLLIDPGSAVNPVEHIEFVYVTVGGASNKLSWWARPRNNSSLGNMTIDICGLNRSDLIELREDHYTCVVKPQVEAIKTAIRLANYSQLELEFKRARNLLTSRNAFVGLTYDALRRDVPDETIKDYPEFGWPPPSQIC